MGDADAFAAFAAMVLVAEGDESVPVLKSDSARGLEARRGDAHELIEEKAVVRVASAFRHALKATPLPSVRYHYTTGIAAMASPAAEQRLDGERVWMGMRSKMGISQAAVHLRRFAATDAGPRSRDGEQRAALVSPLVDRVAAVSLKGHRDMRHLGRHSA